LDVKTGHVPPKTNIWGRCPLFWGRFASRG
jgi:hypothetical protein